MKKTAVLVSVSVVLWFCGTFSAAAKPAATLQDLALRPASTPKTSPEPVTWLRVAENVRIAAYYLPPPAPEAMTILYSYGTLEDLQGKRHLLDKLHALGCGVIGYDYEGFGSSEGEVSLLNALRDCNRVYKFLTEEEKIPPERIIVSGYSMGSGPTSFLASRYPVAGVIIEAGFASLYQAIVPFADLPGDVYCNEKWLRGLTAPLLILHGRNDSTVPVRNAGKLYAAAAGEKEIHIVDADHCDIRKVIGDDEYFGIIANFINRIAAKNPTQPL